MSNTSVKVDSKQVEVNLKLLTDKMLSRLEFEMGSNIAWAEYYAKQTAPWTDRTSNARNSLMGTGPSITSHGFTTVLSGGMEYSPYLELSNFGKYRIITPTIEMAWSRLMSSIADLLV